MDIGRIRSFYNHRPAHPFVIHTVSGESYRVEHPEAMAIGEEDQIILLLAGPYKMHLIDMASITEITRDFTKQENSAEA